MTVAGWPAFTLPISDSLSGTTSCIEERSLRTANAELEELDEEEVGFGGARGARGAASAEAPPVAAAPVLDPDPLEELLLEALVVPLAVTTSPT